MNFNFPTKRGNIQGDLGFACWEIFNGFIALGNTLQTYRVVISLLQSWMKIIESWYKGKR